MHQQDKAKKSTQSLEEQELTLATYRMTIDFRALNKVTLNEYSTQLPSVQAIEVNFADAIVSTLDIANMFPSILLEEGSHYQDEIL